MKKILLIALIISFISAPSLLSAKNNIYLAKYKPVSKFMDQNSTLSQWYMQYYDTTSGNRSFKDFLERIASSDVAFNEAKRRGIRNSQLTSLISELATFDLNNVKNIGENAWLIIKQNMDRLDVLLMSLEAYRTDSEKEEFRREIFRGARPLTEVAMIFLLN